MRRRSGRGGTPRKFGRATLIVAIIFAVVFLLNLVAELLGWSGWRGPDRWITWFMMVGTAATATIIYVQAEFLRQQNELSRLQDQTSTLIELEKIWRSEPYLILRARWAENQDKKKEDLEGLEPLIEFLEEVAVLRSLSLLDDELIWDSTIGWHAARYYFYCRDQIMGLRAKWKDHTTFTRLKELWEGYLSVEQRERKKSIEEVEKEFQETKEPFMAAERGLICLLYPRKS